MGLQETQGPVKPVSEVFPRVIQNDRASQVLDEGVGSKRSCAWVPAAACPPPSTILLFNIFQPIGSCSDPLCCIDYPGLSSSIPTASSGLSSLVLGSPVSSRLLQRAGSSGGAQQWA